MEEIKQGRIINIISNLFLVEIEGQIYECTSRGIFKNKEEKPVVGDIVRINLSDNQNTIMEIVERKLYLKRPKMANLTQLILVISAKSPKPDLLMLDKQLAFSEYLKIKPIIIINKKDLSKQETDKIAQIYSEIGYKVIKTNAKELKEDKEEIREILKNNISAFSGNSGVGKSTLINHLLEDRVAQEGELSRKNNKGKNTTTSVKLYKLEDNSYIADTPGFSTFDMFEINYKKLYCYFRELNQYSKDCAYADCTHIKEEECGIRKALEDKKINQERYEHYIKIYEELKDREEHRW